MPHLSLPGTAGSYVLAPYRAEYDESAIVDLRADVALTGYTIIQALITRRQGAAVNSPWEWAVQNGIMRVKVADLAHNVVDVIGTVAHGTPNGERTQLRTVINATANQVVFYKRAPGTPLPDDSGWTTLETLPLGLTSIDTAVEFAIPIRVGATLNGGTGAPATGDFFRTTVKKGAASGGTPIFDPDFEDPSTWVFA